jgi:hypothetical protein
MDARGEPAHDSPGGHAMQFISRYRAALVALTALAGVAISSAAVADSGSISFSVLKAGFVVGGSGGSGVLHFHGRSYRLGIGGISYGFTFGASETRFHGTVTNIRSPGDVAGVYAAGGAGVAVGAGAGAIVLTNNHGAVLTLSGRSIGAIVAADLNGLIVTIR